MRWDLVSAITVIAIAFTLSLSKVAVAVRQTHYERIDYPDFMCNWVLAMEQKSR